MKIENEILKDINVELTIILAIIIVMTFITGGNLLYVNAKQGINTGKSDYINEIENQIIRDELKQFIQTNDNTENYIVDNEPDSIMGTFKASGNTFVGMFELTAYTAGFESTGKHPGDPAYGITASGAEVVEGITIAADWDVIPPGTKVYIEDVGFRWVEDKGGAIKGNKIDIYVENLADAINFGRQHKNVWIVKE